MSIILYIITKNKRSNEFTLVFSSETTSSTGAYAIALKYNIKYFERFKTKIGAMWGAWSPAWRFNSMHPLAAPVLTLPDHKTFVLLPVTLSRDTVLNGY
jgi:hypothetical protein